MSKKQTTTLLSIALFAIVSVICSSISILESSQICLGYVVLVLGCYATGICSGTLIGVLGTIIYCIVARDFQSLLGLTIANFVIGINLGVWMQALKEMNKERGLWKFGTKFFGSLIIVITSTALGMLLKNMIELLVVKVPIWGLLELRNIVIYDSGMHNVNYFIVTSLIILISIPIAVLVIPNNKIEEYAEETGEEEIEAEEIDDWGDWGDSDYNN